MNRPEIKDMSDAVFYIVELEAENKRQLELLNSLHDTECFKYNNENSECECGLQNKIDELKVKGGG